MEPPTVTLRVNDSRIEIDTGELIFPLLALVFCLAYYLDTRGLPEKSMMYAEPLLYVTGLLALTTMMTEATEIQARPDTEDESEQGSEGFIGWGSVDGNSISQETPVEKDTSDGSRFRVASGLVVLVTMYITSLYILPFTVATAGVLGCSLYLLGERSLPKIVVYSVMFTVLTWAVFVRWLSVPLP